jgi:hypothetical protein
MAGPGWAESDADDVLLQLRSSPGFFSGFLDTHQWVPLLVARGIEAAGGHPSAQLRRVAAEAVPPIACWRIERAHLPEEARSPRGLRSHLYRTGAADGSVGDIIAGDFVALATMPELEVAALLPGAERTEEWQEPEVDIERATVSALRLDAVIAPLFRISRSEAQTAIEYHFVFHNFKAAEKRTLAIGAGDQLVFRTKGRIEILDCAATTKSGRIAVSFRRFPI